MRARARQTALDRFDLERLCLPEMMAFIREGEAASRPAPDHGGPTEGGADPPGSPRARPPPIAARR